jgi:hypothetical protein
MSGGCTNCASKGGCEGRKGEERDLLADILPSLYPGKRWGEPDDAARFDRGVSPRTARRLARQAAELLQAPTRYRAAADDESCDWIYVLCVGRAPGIVELRDEPALDVPDGDHLRERYLRVALSHMAPVAAVQEVSFELDREGDLYEIREKPRPGVFDPIVLPRVQKLVDLLVGSGLTYLDFALIDRPPLGYDAGDYVEQYGQEPAIVNFLFYPQPSTAVTTTFVPCASSLC